MKKIIPVLVFGVMFFSSSKPDKILNRPVPAIKGQAISGQQIDSAFFRKKITLINFMYLGCPPCMTEAGILKQLLKSYKPQDFHVLCIAPHTRRQLIDFNANNSSVYSNLRRYYGLDSITYEILPECAPEVETMEGGRNGDVNIKPECTNLSDLFNVKGYPCSFLVDSKGIVRKRYNGLLSGASDSIFVQQLRRDVNTLLKQ